MFNTESLDFVNDAQTVGGVCESGRKIYNLRASPRARRCACRVSYQRLSNVTHTKIMTGNTTHEPLLPELPASDVIRRFNAPDPFFSARTNFAPLRRLRD
ncbi:hypothetical protein EVAR_29466_1 [Eumeta japonica]|uniref:Uncharacterized protein n=1 Tax=Eumeta variegata TaxID=151549 RepID=A0A4C1WU38_EUMVA|nr:hypothetical protein EVAR_29466_1 [Eumeta japonica]